MEMRYQVRVRSREYGPGTETVLASGMPQDQAMRFLDVVMTAADPNEHVEYVISPSIAGRLERKTTHQAPAQKQ